MGIPTLISTHTASDSSSIDITSGIDSTYDEYMFVFTDIGPSEDGPIFSFQANVAGQSGFNETVTDTVFRSYHTESDTGAVSYKTDHDQAQGTAAIKLTGAIGSGSDESAAGILHLFSPSSTTYVTHFYSRLNHYGASDYTADYFVAGYFNVTGAIDEVTFKMESGNFDGVIQMYGIS